MLVILLRSVVQLFSQRPGSKLPKSRFGELGASRQHLNRFIRDHFFIACTAVKIVKQLYEDVGDLDKKNKPKVNFFYEAKK